MFTPLGEVYQDPEIARQASECNGLWSEGAITRNLEYTAPLGNLATENALLEHVENLPEYDWKETRERSALLLGALPASTLLDNFGERVMAWTYANIGDTHQRRMDEGLADEGYDPRLLRRASDLAWGERKPPRADSVLTQNRVMEGMLSNVVPRIDLPSALQAAALSRKGLSSNHVAEFSVIPLQSVEGNLSAQGYAYDWEGKDELDQKPGVRYTIWLDTSTGFAVTHNGVPQAVVGVVSSGTNELQIRQMQRLFGKTFDPADPSKGYNGIAQPRGLRRLDWHKLMLNLTAQAAEQLGFESVGIWASNKICQQRGVYITSDQATEKYDIPAARNHFYPDENNNWHKPVAELLS